MINFFFNFTQKSIKDYTLPLLLLFQWIGFSTIVEAQSLYPKTNDNHLVVKPKAKIIAYSFDLKDVTLGDCDFKRAMENDKKWLLALEPDRFLNRFLLYAGITPKAAIYGGWESNNVSGHTLGHYLSACALQYASTGDARFKNRVDYIVSELARCQANYTGVMQGYVGGIPEQTRIFTEISQGNVYSSGFDLNGGWVPLYTLHKLYAGLVDAYLYCDNQQAKTIVVKCADWLINITNNLDDQKFQFMLGCEFGGMNDLLVSIYAITGEESYLTLANRFYHKVILDPLSQMQDQLNGLHANTQIPLIVGSATNYMMTNNTKMLDISNFFWDRVVNHHSYANGGNSNFEHFGEPDHLNDRLSTNTTETCNSYNMLKLTNKLFSFSPEAKYMDYYERTLYNHILSTQNPETGMVCYYMNHTNGGVKAFSTEFDSFWCCVGTGFENHVKYTESIYSHGLNDSLFVNLFIPSELNWKDKNIKIKQTTRFPYSDTTRLEITEGNASFKLLIRYPYWVNNNMSIKINGENYSFVATPGNYITIDRNWVTGEKIEVVMPMQFQTQAIPDNPKRKAFLYGPIVMVAPLGNNQISFYDIPIVVTDSNKYNNSFERLDNKSLFFTSKQLCPTREFNLVPFYAVYNQKYAVYLDCFSTQDWANEQTKYYDAINKEMDLRSRTTDEIRFEMQSERDHNLTGQNSNIGTGSGLNWRDASNGGWFEFDLTSNGDTTVQLYAKYWGSDEGSRIFDIQVEGQTIYTQTLKAWFPNKLYECVYEIPTSLLKNKIKIKVRFQATPGNTAGGVFGCRLIKKDQKTALIYAQTIDYIEPGVSISETTHTLKTYGLTLTTNLMNKSGRDATSIGWFSYSMKVAPSLKNQLAITYFGGETSGIREFDIYVEGQKIASDTVLLNKYPQNFYYKIYNIPESLTNGRSNVEVKFKTSEGKTVGRIFGIRTFSEIQLINNVEMHHDTNRNFYSIPFSSPEYANSILYITDVSGRLVFQMKCKNINFSSLNKILTKNNFYLFGIYQKGLLTTHGKFSISYSS